MWGTNKSDEVFYKYGGTGWKQVPGPAMKRIHVSGDGEEVWGITPENDDVYYRNGA